MSFAVVRMQKMKSHDLKGIQFHNQRERESKTNPDIDKTRSHENYDLVNDEPIDYNERVKEIIESQKVGTRKTRKDAVLVNELLVTSDRYFFERLGELKRWENSLIFNNKMEIQKQRLMLSKISSERDIVGGIACAKIVIKYLPSIDDPQEKNTMYKALGTALLVTALGGALVWLVPWAYGLLA